MPNFVIKNPRCPICGELAEGTFEEMNGVGLLDIDEATGNADYDGETKVIWSSQITSRDRGTGAPLLVCPEGHDWGMEGEEDE